MNFKEYKEKVVRDLESRSIIFTYQPGIYNLFYKYRASFIRPYENIINGTNSKKFSKCTEEVLKDVVRKRGYISGVFFSATYIEKEGWTPKKNTKPVILEENGKLTYLYNWQQVSECPLKKRTMDPHLSEIISKMGIEVKQNNSIGAAYVPWRDRIYLPDSRTFISDYQYNATIAHEIIHATGSGDRLNRKSGESYYDDDYVREEMVAEIGSMFVMRKSQTVADYANHLGYLDMYLKKEDIPYAVKEAEKAYRKYCR